MGDCFKRIKFTSPPRARSGEVNYDFFDIFTWAHFLIGIFYGVIHLSFLFSLMLAVAWELIENPLKSLVPRVFPHATADTLKNSVGDVIAVLSGWGIITYLGVQI
jgi:hypothetical protein